MLKFLNFRMPTLNNLLKVDSEELKGYLVSGIQKQKEDLIRHKHLNSSQVFEVTFFSSQSLEFCSYIWFIIL